MKRTSTHMTLGRANRLRRVFGLREFPDRIPYDAHCGLDLPDYMTAKEITMIAAGAAMSLAINSPWYIGDLLNWLKNHRDAPISYSTIVTRLRTTGRYGEQTLSNYMSVSRAIPLRERHINLSFRHHDVVRSRWLPPAVRKELLDRAESEKLSPNDLTHQREIYRRTLGGASDRGALRSQVAEAARRLHRSAIGDEHVFADQYSAEIHAMLKLLDSYRGIGKPRQRKVLKVKRTKPK
ncbi:MAG: hypothetical protein WBQ34_10235 [Candidatus Acidiferrales bacterium]